MTLASLIRQSEDNFKLTQKLITALSEKFNFSFEDGWSTVSPNKTVDNLQKHFRRERKRNDPLAQVKKPRTAFSFFTQATRPVVQDKNPNASFGDLSRLVSADWKKLTPSQLKKYKDMETADKERYRVERDAVLANLEQSTTDSTSQPVESTTTEPSSEPVKKAKSSKGSKSGKGSKPETAPVETSSTPAKPSKSKGGKSSGGKKKGKNQDLAPGSVAVNA